MHPYKYNGCKQNIQKRKKYNLQDTKRRMDSNILDEVFLRKLNIIVNNTLMII